jgi:hypothetical protein
MNRFAFPVLAFLAFAVAAQSGCASQVDDPETNPDDGEVTEADLRAEDAESFAPLEATEAELSGSKGGARRFDHEFTLFAIPAPKLTSLSWRSPGALARRTLINEGFGFSRAIGHVAIRLDCGAYNGKAAEHRQTGQSNEGDEFRTMVMKEKAGLGVLFRTVSGVLETEEELNVTFKERYENGRITFLRHGISGETCHALLDYIKTYDARDVEKQYGFVRPSHQEGSGCSAFGLSMMKLAGLMEPYMQSEWAFDVKVPMTLIGGTTNPGNSVGVARLFLLGRPWAREGEPNLRINGWDPTMMFKSIRLRAKKTDAANVESRGKATGIVVDATTRLPSTELKNGTYFKGTPNMSSNDRFLTRDF